MSAPLDVKRADASAKVVQSAKRQEQAVWNEKNRQPSSSKTKMSAEQSGINRDFENARALTQKMGRVNNFLLFFCVQQTI